MKNFSYYFLCGIALIMLAACGSSSSKNEEEKITVTGANGKEYTSYQEACRAEDFEAALKFVDKYETQAMEKDEYDRYISENVEAYQAARDFVFNAESQYLLAIGSTEASDRVVFLLNSLPKKGKALQEGYEGNDARTSIVDGSRFNKDFAWYCDYVYSFNSKCIQIMELCISQNNKYLADKIVGLVKETPTSEKSGGFEYTVHYTNNDKLSIQEMYNEAINSGKLK